jgi:hypothetical protein
MRFQMEKRAEVESATVIDIGSVAHTVLKKRGGCMDRAAFIAAMQAAGVDVSKELPPTVFEKDGLIFAY